MNRLLFYVVMICFSVSLQAQNDIQKIEKSKNGFDYLTPSQHREVKKLNAPNESFSIDLTRINAEKLGHSANSKNLNPKIPLDKNGKLISVEGKPVAFKTSSNEEISSICFTPSPSLNSYNERDASCGYIVPCDLASNRDAANISTQKYFQLEWHVIRNGGASTNISQATIDDLMAELNSDFAAENMTFCANPANFYEDATNYFHNNNTEEFSLKAAYNVNPSQLINIYVVGSMGPGGYARFPYDPNGGTSANGGIVLNRGNCSLGTHTLAHEMGHVFGLEHTFSGVDERSNCSSCYERVRNVNGSSNTSGVPTPIGGPYTNEGDREGDWCSDTNPHDTYAFTCATSSNTNNACDSHPWANAPVNNHMSYSFCSSQFTAQQNRRMHCMIDTYLTSWTSYGGAICGTNPPAADFIGTPTTWQAPANVSFTDNSLPNSVVTSWTWVFDVAASNTVTCVGCTGTNATYVGQNPPVVNYPNAGTYTVSLTVNSPNGSDTETKTNYITVTNPVGDCDTLSTQWLTPAPMISAYNFGPNDYVTGIPAATLGGFPNPIGFYEAYFSPNPGVTPIGGVRVGLGNLNDIDDNTTFQVVIYNDDGAGGLLGAPIGGVAGISPTQIGIPGTGFYEEVWIPFLTPAIPTTAQFHVGVEIFPGDATDELTVMSSASGQGQGAALNNTSTANFGYLNYNTYIGLDFDLDIIPMLGEYEPLPLITSFVENVVCDTTVVTIFDTVLYSTPTNYSIMFSDGTEYNSTTDPGSITRTYTTPGPDIIQFAVINECGRSDTTTWILPYNFESTPDAEFTSNPTSPICEGTNVDFTANTSGYIDYYWDFGDGTTLSSGTTANTSHTYSTAGNYYVELIATDAGYAPLDTFYLEDFESGWPAGYARFDNDPFTPDVAVNPPFTGTNATAWLSLDADVDGDTEAVSTSWNGVGQQADDWMITSGIGPLPANQRLYWDAEASDINFSDGYEVRISTTQLPANTTNYNTLLFSTPAENAFNTTRSVDLSGYAGQTVFIAFRNNSTYANLLYIDDIRIGSTSSGCSSRILKTDYIEVIDCSVTPPTAAFTINPSVGCNLSPTSFIDGSTGSDPTTSWLWNFGDGNFSIQQNPTHTYASTGTYLVTLEACNSGGCTSISNNYTINALNASVNGVVQPTCGNTGQFNISATDGSGNYSYSIDNGTTFTAPASNVNMSQGTYNIVVRDNITTCEVTTSITLTNSGTPSTGAFTDTICANSTYTLPSGNVVFGAGVYADTIAGSTCDSIITATLVTTPSSTYYGLYAATSTDYLQVNPLTGSVIASYNANANSLGWINGAFTMHEQSATLYWLSEVIQLQSLDLTNGNQTTQPTEIDGLPFFWGMRYYNGHLYTITSSLDNDKTLVRIDPTTGDIDGSFTGIEINGSAGLELLLTASPVINPLNGIFYIPMYGNTLLAFDINAGTGNIVNLSGYVVPNGYINLLEINEHSGQMYGISGFTDVVSITPTNATNATVSLIKTLTSASGFANPVSAFDSDNELYIFQAATGCSQYPLVAVDVNTGTEYCNSVSGEILYQMEYLNCSPASTLRAPKQFDVKVYPNPTAAELTIDFDLLNDGIVEVQFYNISGELISDGGFEGLAGTNSLKLDVTNLHTGMYLVKVKSGRNLFTTKIIKL